jgi:hypothetical protein
MAVTTPVLVTVATSLSLLTQVPPALGLTVVVCSIQRVLSAIVGVTFVPTVTGAVA